MLSGVTESHYLAALDPLAFITALWPYLKLALGFSLVIFVHEMGHFLAAK